MSAHSSETANLLRSQALIAKTQGRLSARVEKIEADLAELSKLVGGAASPRKVQQVHASPAERATVAQAARAVERLTGVPATLIRSPSRTKRVVRARWLAMKIAHDCGLSIAGIGRALAMDHTTVMHGLRKIAAEQAGAKHDDQA